MTCLAPTAYHCAYGRLACSGNGRSLGACFTCGLHIADNSREARAVLKRRLTTPELVTGKSESWQDIRLQTVSALNALLLEMYDQYEISHTLGLHSIPDLRMFLIRECKIVPTLVAMLRDYITDTKKERCGEKPHAVTARLKHEILRPIRCRPLPLHVRSGQVSRFFSQDETGIWGTTGFEGAIFGCHRGDIERGWC
eukprot:comp13400_c0_seq1/m.8889 comp13400_c0_seq1/g.8889  ORF comp13400_c0_seq1/g.8889 comp13400_c0_seq1/m.8889 type:complete len:197 (-) comp13400_c0_seq1:27-617(-)